MYRLFSVSNVSFESFCDLDFPFYVFCRQVIGAVSSCVCSGVSCASVFVCVVRGSAGMARS